VVSPAGSPRAGGPRQAEGALAVTRNGEEPAVDFPDSLEDWKDEAAARAALERLYQSTVRSGQAQIEWYNRNGSRTGRRSRQLRLAAIVAGTLGTLAPIIEVAVGSPPTNIGYIFLAMAAAIIAGDSAFGVSSSWMRFRSSQLELERLLQAFRFDWALEQARLAGRVPDAAGREALLKLQRSFAEAVLLTVQTETQTWVQEFRGALAELARTYRAGVESRQPGAVEVRVADAQGPVKVTFDNRPAGELVGGAWQLTDVAPGVHTVRLTGRRQDRDVAASGAVTVKPGELSVLELRLA
jgi:hypothetical protein